jgi:hypothetical protein
MRREALVESRSRNKNGLLYEAQWQFEFYLAGSSILPTPFLLSPNVGEIFLNYVMMTL